MDTSKFSDSVTPLCVRLLDAPPSCLEFIPRKHNPGYEYFIVGTYTLLPGENETNEENKQDEPQDQEAGSQSTKPQEKVGSLKLFRINDNRV